MTSGTSAHRIAATRAQLGAGGRPPKRKREIIKKYYAVRAGHQRGVFETWAECQAQTSGYSGAVYKAFLTRQDAEAFVAGKNPRKSDEPARFYAVAVGTRPGIYEDWPSAQLAIQGAKGPKYKKFDTREDALQFIREKGNLAAYKALGLAVDAADDDDDDDDDDEEEDEDDVLQVTEPSAKKAKLSATSKTPIEIYTDGASQANGTARAVAGVGVFFGVGDPRNVSERLKGEPQTNQRAELTAIMRALQSVAATDNVVLYSDSQYSIKCVTEWFQGWRRNGWVTRSGPVKNRDLVEAIVEMLETREEQGGRTKLEWVKGHESNPGNIAADRLAVQGCRR